MQEKRQVLDSIQSQLEKKRVKLFEIFLHFSRTLSIEAKKREVDGLKVSSGVGIGLRVLIDEHLGFSYTTDTGFSSVSSVVENAIASAKMSDPNPAYDFAEKREETNQLCKIFDPDFTSSQTKGTRFSPDTSGIRFIRTRPNPFGDKISSAITTISLFSAPRPRLPPFSEPPM